MMTTSFTDLQRAIAFAARAHQGQLRKDGRTPYSSHPFRVCMTLSQLFSCNDIQVLIAAALHDTIEDTTTDYDDIVSDFGADVANWVRCLSKDKRLPENEREAAYAHDLATACWQVQLIKMADMYDNLGDMDQLPAARRPLLLARIRFYLDRMEPTLKVEAQSACAEVRKLLHSYQARP